MSGNEKTAGWYRRQNQDISGNLKLVTTTDDTTLVTVRNASSTIYIQRVIIYVTTDAAQSWSFQDSANTPVEVAVVTISPGDDTRWDFWFGEIGMPLTEGKNFALNASAVGLAGNVEWEGYQRLTSPMAMGPTN